MNLEVGPTIEFYDPGSGDTLRTAGLGAGLEALWTPTRKVGVGLYVPASFNTDIVGYNILLTLRLGPLWHDSDEHHGRQATPRRSPGAQYPHQA